ncbi:MAG: tRNA (adenosine(37)-N6)-threonylcarbamoyltransferase complex ATPase subunit type 1 TsaE [Patescibacteria group bacterium]|nr:tRNA (adenosine(37)-N6)-threonylcarbamoyltransferase complex ATPase subunit type 1 TsaE [Patescibacteria group bacterium]MCL5431521.1 tRNA (adenosine(37)-N6)-threonylcarbamoyltransferase complex ATPase subunit type 1 TsaE [Patescibacteria group bacterium]
MTIKTHSGAQTQKFGEEFAKKIAGGAGLPAGGQVVCLYGDLGAGKTTFVQGMARGLGIKKRIVSPTFIIVRQYKKLFHIDLYRLDSAANLGLEEIMGESGNIVLIEWPEKIENILPKNHWEIRFKIVNEKTREISVKHYKH